MDFDDFMFYLLGGVMIVVSLTATAFLVGLVCYAFKQWFF